MIEDLRRLLVGSIVVLVVGNGPAQAQAVARSFEELRLKVKPGDRVYVTDDTARESRAQILDLSLPSLALSMDGTRRDLGVGDAAQSSSQPPSRVSRRPEVFFSVGRASFLEGGEFGTSDWASLGAGATLPLSRRFSTQVEVNRMLGTAVQTFKSVRQVCRAGVCGPPESYEYRSGISSLTVASAGFLYYFSQRRLQPFVGGGLGVVWGKGTRTRAEAEKDFHTADAGSSLSYGVRIPIARQFSITPQFRFYVAGNHIATQGSIAAGFRW